jgi:hypothetical protein
MKSSMTQNITETDNYYARFHVAFKKQIIII